LGSWVFDAIALAEAATLDEMGKKLDILVPEMLEENGPHVPFCLLANRHGYSNHAHWWSQLSNLSWCTYFEKPGVISSGRRNVTTSFGIALSPESLYLWMADTFSTHGERNVETG
jgi:hypothetical protein